MSTRTIAIIGVCLLGWMADAGVVELPRPAALERAEGAVVSWQNEQAGRISCQNAAGAVLDRTPEEALRLVERHCR